MPKRWRSQYSVYVESPRAVESFLDEYEALCRRHGLALGHEDGHGSFMIEPFDEANIEWARGANLDAHVPIDPPEPLSTQDADEL